MVNSMNEITNVILRTVLILVIIFLLFKLMGRKQVSQMDIFDYITGITIGSIVADISLDIEKNLLAGIISLLIYCLSSIIISYINLKSIKARKFFNGRVVTLIENGHINRQNLSKNKITIDDLETEARLMGYFHLEEINNAFLEPNGQISFESKESSKPATKKDLSIKTQNHGMIYNIIIDGHIIDENLKAANITKSWLNHELKVLGKKVTDILLLTVDSNQQIKYYLK